MPSKNSLKIYTEDGFYHIYNRGVEKRDVFLDEQDYGVFLNYVKTYLLPKNIDSLSKLISQGDQHVRSEALQLMALKNFSTEIELVCYCLMPNHFHFLIKQTSSDAIKRFMQALNTRYTVYFNKRNKRVGALFQGVYKAVLIESDEQLLHLSRYIHLNPFAKSKYIIGSWADVEAPFSLPEYFGQRQTKWIKPEYILQYFRKGSPNNSYEDFMGINVEPELVAPFAIDYEEF